MNKKPLKIGPYIFKYPFVLAPLAGITDKTMRSLCAQAGASLTYTEMVSAKGLWYGDRKTGELLQTQGKGPVGFQLFGCEPEILEYAVRLLSDPDHAQKLDRAMEEADCSGAVNRPPMGARTVRGQGLRPPALFDLNAGCPVPKIVRNGEGSALLKDPELLYRCVAGMVRGAEEAAGAANTGATVSAANAGATASAADTGATASAADTGATASAVDGAAPIPITVKIRKGFDRDDDCAVEIAKAAEAAGAAAITVHGRTRQQFYEGKADWDAIARVKAAVKIPVIGNGDVYSGADAIRMMEETGCDGVMIARGALGNPWIFQEAATLWDGGWTTPSDEQSGWMNPSDGQSGWTAPSDRQSGWAAPSEEQGGWTAPSDEQRIRLLLHHIDLVCADKGEHIAVREMRKHVGWYIKGMRGAAQIRRQINTAATAEEMKRLLREFTAHRE